MMFANPVFWVAIGLLLCLRHFAQSESAKRPGVHELLEEGYRELEAAKELDEEWSMEDEDRKLSERIEEAARAKGIRVDV